MLAGELRMCGENNHLCCLGSFSQNSCGWDLCLRPLVSRSCIASGAHTPSRSSGACAVEENVLPLSLSGRQDSWDASLVNGRKRPSIPENLLPTSRSYVVTLLSIDEITHVFLFIDDGVIRQGVCDWHHLWHSDTSGLPPKTLMFRFFSFSPQTFSSKGTTMGRQAGSHMPNRPLGPRIEIIVMPNILSLYLSAEDHCLFAPSLDCVTIHDGVSQALLLFCVPVPFNKYVLLQREFTCTLGDRAGNGDENEARCSASQAPTCNFIIAIDTTR